MAKLCKWCSQINFASILTPRAFDLDADTCGPIYREEYKGTDFCPTVRFERYGKTIRTGPPEDYLPRIRTAHWNDLASNSARSESSFEEMSNQADLEDGDGQEQDERLSDGIGSNEEYQDEWKESSEWESSDGEESEEALATEENVHGDRRNQSGGQAGSELYSSTEEVSETGEMTQESLSASKASAPHFENPCPQISGERFEPTASDKRGKDDNQSDDLTYPGEVSPKEEDLHPVEETQKPKHGMKDRVSKFGRPIHSHQELSRDQDNTSDSMTSASTWSYNSHFTELWRIDLEAQAKGKFDYRRKLLYYLGTVWDVYSRRHDCELCSYFWGRMRSNDVIRRGFITKSRCVFKLLEFKCKSLEDPHGKEIIMLNLLAVYSYKLGDPDKASWTVKMPFLLHGRHKNLPVLEDPPAPFRDEDFGEARPRGDTCDPSLFHQWLFFCEENHTHPKVRTTGDISFRLIDLQDSCLIEWKGPAADAPRYFVLSYIWGTSPQLVTLTLENYSQFHEKGAMVGMYFNYTIRDTLQLARKMGERYVWIDALCIIQDSSEDKATQIPQMHLIYGLAILTIVAAHGEDADAGLTGVQPGSRGNSKVLLNLDDITIQCRSNSEVFNTHDDVGLVENYLWKSKYSSRGWTFQESLLSTRALVFTRKQVFWECPTCTWAEETHWESKSIAYVGQRGIIDPTPQDIWEDNFDRAAYGGPGEKTREFQRNSYPNLVKAYSQRQLTNEGDILNAFTGVLASIKAREKTRFLYALRERHIGNDLLWGWDRPSAPRDSGGWPSWSWLAWKGVVDIPNEPRHNSYDPTDDIEPSDGVRCYILEDGKTLRLINESGGWRFHEGYAKRGGGIFDPAMFHKRGDKERQEAKSPTKSAAPRDQQQEVSLADLQALPCYQLIQPNFHLIFHTWCTPVVLKTHGSQREIYIDDGDDQMYYGFIMNGQPSFRLDQGLGNISMDLVPDGPYEALHMNNNQSSQFGHMLIKRHNGIARRVCMVVGPLDVSEKKYCSNWELIILG